jgi:hypothetical protein
MLGSYRVGGQGCGSTSLSLPLFSCFFFQPFQHPITWRILPIPPTPALFGVFLIDVGIIGQDHIPNGARVLVLAVGLDRDFLPKG